MWSEHEFIEVLKSTLPYYIILALPILMIISPTRVDAAADFTVYRLQQYDLHSVAYGSRSSLLNLEARTLDAASLARRCVLAKLSDLTPSLYQSVISQGAAALVILLPVTNLTAISSEQRKFARDLERTLLETETAMAVYLAHETDELHQIYESVKAAVNANDASSAAAALVGSLASDGYQLVAGSSQSKLINDMSVAYIQGKLSGYGLEEQLPTVTVVAHYDAFGAAPELSFGGDSNGSGVAMLLELARILSRLYVSPRTHPKLNLMFVLTGGGYINYQGSKKFLEDELDGSDSTLLTNSHFALCLDTLASGSSLFLHVSKRPKEASPGDNFYESLRDVSTDLGVKVEMVHKKINLQDDTQAWEHEKFSMRRLPAFTLSRLQSHKGSDRGSIFDTSEGVDLASLTINTQVVAQALLRLIYNNTVVDDLLSDGLSVSEESLRAWLHLVTSQPRSPQLLSGKTNSLVSALHEVLNRYTSDARIAWMKPDKRDPEFAFYDVTRSVLSAYVVKPAAFDLFLSLVVMSYLGIFYFLLQYFPLFYTLVTRLAVPAKNKAH